VSIDKTKVCQCCGKVFAKDPRVNPKQWAKQRFCSNPCQRTGRALESCQRRGFGPETTYYQSIIKYGNLSAAARSMGIHTRTLERRLWVEGGFCGSCGLRPIAQEISSDKCLKCREDWYNQNKEWRASDEGQQYAHDYVRTEEYKESHKEVCNTYNRTEKGWHASRSGFIRRRDRKKKVGGDGLSTKEVKLVRETYGNKCFICNMTQQDHMVKYHRSLHLDHFNPLSAGYPLALDNVVLLCCSHNDSKSDQNPNDFFTSEQIEGIKKVWEILCQKRKS